MERSDRSRSSSSRGGSRNARNSRSGGGGSFSRGGDSSRSRERSPRPPRPRQVIPKDAKIEYKNLPLIQRFVSDRGKIVSRRLSGISAKEQRRVVEAIKQARFLALIPTGGVKK